MPIFHSDGLSMGERASITETVPADYTAIAPSDGDDRTWLRKDNSGALSSLTPQVFRDVIRCEAGGGIIRAATGAKTFSRDTVYYQAMYLSPSSPHLQGSEIAWYAQLKPGNWLPTVYGLYSNTSIATVGFSIGGILVGIYDTQGVVAGGNYTWVAPEFEIKQTDLYEVALTAFPDPQAIGADQYLVATSVVLKHEDVRP